MFAPNISEISGVHFLLVCKTMIYKERQFQLNNKVFGWINKPLINLNMIRQARRIKLMDRISLHITRSYLNQFHPKFIFQYLPFILIIRYLVFRSENKYSGTRSTLMKRDISEAVLRNWIRDLRGSAFCYILSIPCQDVPLGKCNISDLKRFPFSSFQPVFKLI